MDEASTPTTGDVKVLFRAIVIQRNSMDPVVTNVDNGLLLPPPNRRISFVSARPPTSLHQFIENSGSSASPNFGRDQPHVPTVKSTPTDFQDRLSPPLVVYQGIERFSKWIILLIRFWDRCDRRGRIWMRLQYVIGSILRNNVANYSQ